jgi:hypothetical protein
MGGFNDVAVDRKTERLRPAMYDDATALLQDLQR